MSDNILDITHRHGKEMHQLGLKHSLEMAKLYRDYGENAIDELIKHLEAKLVEEAQPEHNRFDEKHRETCDSCRDAYHDFLQEDHE